MDSVGSIFGGYSQAQQFTDQAAQAQQQAKDVNLQASERSGQMKEQLNSSLANISANRAEANLSPDSPTAQAIQGAVQATASRNMNIANLSSLNQESSLNNQATAYKSASSNAITGGFINGFVKVAQDAAKGAGY